MTEHLYPLLEKWSGVEPARCRNTDGRYGVFLGGWSWDFYGPVSLVLGEPRIEQAAREAIAARDGWGWSKPYTDSNFVIVTSDPWRAKDDDDGIEAHGDGPSLAYSLLFAYLDLLAVNR